MVGVGVSPGWGRSRFIFTTKSPVVMLIAGQCTEKVPWALSAGGHTGIICVFPFVIVTMRRVGFYPADGDCYKGLCPGIKGIRTSHASFGEGRLVMNQEFKK